MPVVSVNGLSKIYIIRVSAYSGLSLSRTRKGPTNLFEIEKVRDRENCRKTKMFTNKVREVNKGLLGMY